MHSAYAAHRSSATPSWGMPPPAPAPVPARFYQPAPLQLLQLQQLQFLPPQPVDITGFIYCPPGWDEQRLCTGADAETISKIAMDTFTDIAYIKEKNAIQITGESHDDVYKAQSQLNTLFFPVIVKSKKQWARPDRPGNWGQRRDSNGGSQGLRRMRSEPSFNKQQQQQPQFAQPQQPQQHYHQHDDRVVPGSSDHQSRRSSGSVHGHGHGHVHHRTSFQSAFSSSSSGGSNRLSTHSSGSYAPSAQWR